jgi:hypothetical protein
MFVDSINSDWKDLLQQLKFNLSQFGNESWDFIKQPTKWSGNDWFKLGLIGVGSNAYNQKLSQRRADAVKAWLVSKGIPSERIIAVGYGEGRPRVSNDTEDNRRLNRRIEFKRIK